MKNNRNIKRKYADGGLQPINSISGTIPTNDSLQTTLKPMSGTTANIAQKSPINLGGIMQSASGAAGLFGQFQNMNSQKNNVTKPVSESSAALSGAMSGASSGASAGAVFGPVGMAIGGGIGAVAGTAMGLIGRNKQKEAYNKAMRQNNINKTVASINAANDTQDYQSTYAKGGIHINPANRGKFNATKARTGKTTEELTHSSNPLTRKRAIFAQNSKHWHHAEGGVQPGNPNAELEQGEPFRTPNGQMAYVKTTAPTHAEGGVSMNLPQGTEILGKNNIPGSDKQYKEVGRKLVKAQNKALQTLSDPQSDNVSRTTANANLANIQAKFSVLMNMQEGQKQNNISKSKYPDGGTVLPKGADFFKANLALQQAERNKILAAHPEAKTDLENYEKLKVNDPNRFKSAQDLTSKYGDIYIPLNEQQDIIKQAGYNNPEDFHKDKIKYYQDAYSGVGDDTNMRGAKEMDSLGRNVGYLHLGLDYQNTKSNTDKSWSPIYMENPSKGYTSDSGNKAFYTDRDRGTKLAGFQYDSDFEKAKQNIQGAGDEGYNVNGKLFRYDKNTGSYAFKNAETNTNPAQTVTTTTTGTAPEQTAEQKVMANVAPQMACGGRVKKMKYAKGGNVDLSSAKWNGPDTSSLNIEDPGFTDTKTENTPQTNVNPTQLGFDNQKVGMPKDFNAATYNKPSFANTVKNFYNNNKQNAGNYANVLATLAPTIYNVASGMQKATKLNAKDYYNPDADSAINMLKNRTYDINPQLESNRVSQRMMERNLRNTGISQASLVGGYAGANIARQTADAQAQSVKQNAENSYKAETANMMYNAGQQKSNANWQTNQANLQSKAAKQNLVGTGLSQLSQYAQVSKAMKGQKNVDAFKASLLPSLMQHYQFDPTLLKKLQNGEDIDIDTALKNGSIKFKG